MPRTATRTRERRANPPQSEALLSFCRHCETIYEPTSSPIRDVCPSCAETRYTRCDHCGTYHLTEETLTTSEPHVLCRSCADALTYTCGHCGQLHETELHPPAIAHNGREICEECLPNYSRCECCGRLFRTSDTRETESGRYCWSCSSYDNGQSIQSYYFKPAPIFRDDPESEPTGLYLGVELEMDYGDADAAATRISSMYGNDFLYFKHDGSLEDGCELVTHPMSPEYMMSDGGKKMWRDICEAALAEGMRSHDTATCGFHVHVSREFFGKTGTAQELTELKLIETVDRLFEPIIYFSRRKREQITRWAPRCDAPKSDGGWAKKAKSVSRFAKSDRYHAVNITNEHTIEFRMFRGTLKADTILATLQFVSGLCHLAKAYNPSQMERLGWYDLCDAIIEHCPTDSSELYNYLIERELICTKGE